MQQTIVRRRVALGVGAAIAGLILGYLLTAATVRLHGAQQAQSFQGVTIRADGGVLIDGWMIYNTMTAGPNSPTMAPAQPQQTPQAKVAPVRITIGLTVGNEVPVCIDTEDGSHCVTVGTLRKRSTSK